MGVREKIKKMFGKLDIEKHLLKRRYKKMIEKELEPEELPEYYENFLENLENQLEEGEISLGEFKENLRKKIKERTGEEYHILGRGKIGGYAFQALPFIIGSIISLVLFGVLFKNPLLLVGGVSLSIALSLSREDSTGYLRAFFMFFSIILLCLGVYFLNAFLALVILFIGYASLSPRLTSEEYHGYETLVILFRLCLGLGIAASPFWAFGLWDPYLGVSLLLIGVGFFVLALPEFEEEVKVKRGLTIIVEWGKRHGDLLAFSSGLFVFAGTLLGVSQLHPWSFPSIFFLILGIGGAFMAFSVHGHHRGEAGFPLYILLLLTVTTAYPDVLGQAVFGPWWPKISVTMQTVFEPVHESITQLKQGMSDVWLMMTCPQCYYEKKMREQQQKSKAEGSVYSVEVTQFRVFSDKIDPAQPLTGIITFENKGEGDARDFNVTLLNPEIYIYNKTTKRYEYVKLKDNNLARIESCSGKQDTTTCGKDILYKGEKFDVSFSYGKSSGNPWNVPVEEGHNFDECRCGRENAVDFDCGGGLDNCDVDKCKGEKDITVSVPITNKNNNKNICQSKLGEIMEKYNLGPADTCSVSNQQLGVGVYSCIYTCTLYCSGTNRHLIYKYGGREVRIGFNYSFKYSTNVSLQVRAMSQDKFNRLMREGKITQTSVISSYTGGPVRASLWTPLEPVVYEKDKENKVFMSFTITNDGTGKILKGTEITIKLPKEVDFDRLGQLVNMENCKINQENNQKVLTCTVKKDIPKGKSATVTFWVKLPPKNFKEIEEKTLTFTGYVNYKYGNERWKILEILPAPFT